MGDKKRKSLTSGSELPKKKTKISSDSQPDIKPKPAFPSKPQESTSSKLTSNAPMLSITGSKKSRKRAADFLSDNEEGASEDHSSETPQVNGDSQAGKEAHKAEKRKGKKAKKAAEKSTNSLTADGVNGVTKKKDSAEVKIDTAKKPVAKSMQAEARLTADQELEEEWGGLDGEVVANETTNDDEDGEGKNDAYLLEGFDSDTSDVEDEGWDGKSLSIPEKGRKNVRKLKEKSVSTDAGVVYMGSIPHGFYEAEMRSYLGQFGEITRLRLSRNKRSGASKHFAFIEFASKDVAKIVAETMDTYLLYKHVLRCKFIADPSKLHKDTWKGANKKFRKIPHDKIEREKLAAPKTVEKWEKKKVKEQKKRDKMAKKLNTIGYKIPDVKLKDPKDAVEQAKMLKQKLDTSDGEIPFGKADGAEKVVKATEAPKRTVAKPESKSKDTAPQTNGDDKEPEVVLNGEAEDAEDSSKKSKKDKKKAKKAKKEIAKAAATETKGQAVPAEEEVATKTKVSTKEVSPEMISEKAPSVAKKKQKAENEPASKNPDVVEKPKEKKAKSSKKAKKDKAAA